MPLSLANLPELQSYLHQHKMLLPQDTLASTAPAGDGNMNRVYRVISQSGATFIIKQAEPFVVKYPSIAAPAERLNMEALFYETVAPYDTVADAMPRLIHADAENRLLIMADLGESTDFMHLYKAGQVLNDDALQFMLGYLKELHSVTFHHPQLSAFQNQEMRALNHQHIFVLPLFHENGVDLSALHPSLVSTAQIWRNDAALTKKLHALGDLYMEDDHQLLHGDYYPGSFLQSDDGYYVIDTEFCFAGHAAWDYGVLLAHLHLSDQSDALKQKVILAAAEAQCETLTIQFAGAEIFRRLLGVAQLPLGINEEAKPALLQRSVDMILS